MSNIVLILTIFYSIPAGIMSLALGFQIWNYNITVKQFAKASLASTIIMTLSNTLLFHIPKTIYLLMLAGIALIINWIVFKGLGKWAFLKLSITLVFIITLIETTGLIPMIFLVNDLQLVELNNVCYLLTADMMVIIFSFITYLLYKKEVTIDSLLQRIPILRKKRISSLTIFIVIQFLILGSVTAYLFENYSIKDDLWVTFAVIFITQSISLAVLLYKIRKYSRMEDAAVASAQQVHAEDVGKMFSVIRSQRHDFVNHVLIIKGLLETQKYDEAIEYMAELVGETTKMNEIINIGNPVFAALIQSKLVRAQTDHIRLDYNFENLQRIELGVQLTDYAKIVGNLIDNAMDEANKKSGNERWVQVQGRISHGKLFLMVKNKGNLENVDSIFEAGYSTKSKGEHAGLGLSIVLERTQANNGSVMVSQERDCVIFEVMLPLKK